MPRAASSLGMRRRSSLQSVPGGRGSAYLIERDGFLFQSPITWYVRERKWDLPPGYEKVNLHFDRPVEHHCLYCHANRVEPVDGPGQPVSAADLPGPRDRLRAVPRAGRAPCEASQHASTAGT